MAFYFLGISTIEFLLGGSFFFPIGPPTVTLENSDCLLNDISTTCSDFCLEPLMVGITLTNPTELELDADPLRLPTSGSPGKQRQTWGVK